MGSLFGERRRIGSTSLELPAFGMGTAHVGELYGTVDEHVSQATFDAAWTGGVRYYDTATWYAIWPTEIVRYFS